MTEFDPLAEFSKEHKPRRPGEYEAFSTQPRTQTLRISRANGIDDYQSYAYFIKCKGGRRKQTSLRIYFSFESVRVTGEHLGPVLAAIGEKRCDCITEFDKTVHEAPAKGEPLITRIEFTNYEQGKPLSTTLKEEDDFLLRPV